jgi:hypothetical protein
MNSIERFYPTVDQVDQTMYHPRMVYMLHYQILVDLMMLEEDCIKYHQDPIPLNKNVLIFYDRKEALITKNVG